MPLDNVAQYLYPALGWRLRNHHGGRVRPRRSPARALLQLVVLNSQLGHGATQLGRAVDEVVDQPQLQRFLP